MAWNRSVATHTMKTLVGKPMDARWLQDLRSHGNGFGKFAVVGIPAR